jgi:hypothetical protein
MSNLRSTIAAKVLNNIPPHVKPIDFLIENLSISRESVYRRIRGDISFTLEEIAILSVKLGFSIDELIMNDKPTHVLFDMQTSSMHNSSEIFIAIFQQYFQDILDSNYTNGIKSIAVLNHVPCEFIVFFDNLFKFVYYRQIHQCQESSYKFCYSDVTVPKELVSLQKNVTENLAKVNDNTFIIDSEIVAYLIQEIQYFYKRKLISQEEVIILKEDLFGLVDMMENIAQTGSYNSEAKFNFYLSLLNIESSSRYFEYEKRTKSQFYINAFEPISITHSMLCRQHKKWLDSVRKYTTLITQTNEILQIKYFAKQRTHIEQILENQTKISL